MLSMMAYGLEYSFGQFGSSVLVESPTNFPTFLTVRVEWEAEKVLTQHKHFSVVTETPLFSAQVYNIAL